MGNAPDTPGSARNASAALRPGRLISGTPYQLAWSAAPPSVAPSRLLVARGSRVSPDADSKGAMQERTSIALAAAALLLGGCGNAATPENRGRDGGNRVAREETPPPERTGPQEPRFGPEEAMAGTWTTRFEHSDFNSCWFGMTAEAAAEFRRLYPRDGADAPQYGRAYRLRIMGQRTIDSAGGPARYGHLGGWRCEIRATRILSAEVIPGSGPPAPPAADRTPIDPDAERARKAAGAEPPAFSEGHDRARLEEQRRTMPPGVR